MDSALKSSRGICWMSQISQWRHLCKAKKERKRLTSSSFIAQNATFSSKEDIFPTHLTAAQTSFPPTATLERSNEKNRRKLKIKSSNKSIFSLKPHSCLELEPGRTTAPWRLWKVLVASSSPPFPSFFPCHRRNVPFIFRCVFTCMRLWKSAQRRPVLTISPSMDSY